MVLCIYLSHASAPARAHVYTRTHARAHAHTHTHTHTHTHAHTRTHARTHTRARARTHTHTIVRPTAADAFEGGAGGGGGLVTTASDGSGRARDTSPLVLELFELEPNVHVQSVTVLQAMRAIGAKEMLRESTRCLEINFVK